MDYKSKVKELIEYPREANWYEFKTNWYEPAGIGEYISYFFVVKCYRIGRA